MLDIPQLNALAVVLFIALALCIYARRAANGDLGIPPGPLGMPILGNLLEVPGKHLATYFRRLLNEYGGIVSLNLAGFRLILIGDIRLAKELLERHASKHSSRPVVHYIRYHLDPTDIHWGTMKEGRNHTIGRKLTTGVMSAVRAGKTEPLQEFEAILNIQRLLNDGSTDWFHHMRLVAADSVLTVGFGVHCPTGQESELKEILYMTNEAVQHSTPSASIVNALPFLDLLPGPMPWRIRAQALRKREDAIYKKLVDEALTGKASCMNTWAASFAREDKPEGDQRLLLRDLISAAIETTAISLQTFVLACVRYPEWIATAQKEIDNVVGHNRLPSFKDRPFLPYVEAIVRETHRWRPAARFGIPHQAVANDFIEYRGQKYFIPEGSIIFFVPWAIEHDQSRFEAHDRFMPERFLDAGGNLKPNYETSAFGFGRRGCPGVPFAERTLWINIAILLWTFNICGSVEIDPKTALPYQYDDSDAAFEGDLTNCPKPFPVVFKSRSPQHAEVARREWDECEKDLNVLLPLPEED